MLSKPDDIARMSSAELQKLLFEFQARQLELEIQNQELRATLGCHEHLFEKSPIGCLTLDREGAVQSINNTAINLLGYAKQDIDGAFLADHVHPSDKTAYDRYLEKLADTLTTQALTLKLNRSNGKIIDVECRGSAGITDDKQTLICLVLNDITEHKQSEKKLSGLIEQLENKITKKSGHLTKSNRILKKTIDELNYSRHQLLEREAKLNSILNASIEGIIVIDTVGTIVSVNAAVENIFGYSAEELIGYSVNQLMPISIRKKHDNYLRKYLHIFISKTIGQIREVEGLHKDGSLVPLDMTIAEFPLDGAQYYSGIVRDVSARKLQERQEKEHLEKLAHVTRLGLMGEMASGIAHEVNQPLSAVVNYTQVCLRFIQNENPDLEKIGEIMHKANQQALKAGQIIHSMREFVKPRKIHRSTVDINALIYDAISIFESDFKQHLVAMLFDLTKNLPHVYIDQVQIEQVILNLVKNSIDALKELPQFTQRQLSIETSLDDLNYVVVRVKDNGSGLTPLQREKILTPFFTTKVSGMGMGLSISRSLVEAHHGTLHFNSKEDKGTTFYFTLPTEIPANARNKA
ncbi:PAS domain S-box protein [Methyloglobulus sp.]|uniref:PAS domain-containing sensor histidine kinase n=1 Tax=Methyloglobulus sp. TaxID=2518622 RepID=UPI00398A41E3